MTWKSICLWAVLVLAWPLAGSAAGTAGTVSGTRLTTDYGTQDMVYDATRDRIYIATPVALLRYDLASASYLSPIPIPRVGNFRGLDISPNDRQLAVADTGTSDANGPQAWVWLVDLDTLAFRRSTYTRNPIEAGTFSVAYGADRALYVSSTCFTSSIGALRRLSATGEWTFLRGSLSDTMLSASGDGETIAFVMPGISSVQWGLIDVPTGQIVDRSDDSGEFGWEISTDRFGSQFTLPTYHYLRWYNEAYQLVAAPVVSPSPVGLRHHPVEPVLYVAFSDTTEVRIYDATTRAVTGSLSTGTNFTWPGNQPMWNGRIRLSRDGSLLMVSVNFGVHFFRLYDPLSIQPLSGWGWAGQPMQLPAAGSIGNGGTLSYDVPVQPAHGTAQAVGNQVVYTPEPGFSGRDRFQYRVRYGRDLRTAAVDVEVRSPGQLAANNDSAIAAAGPQSIDVLANDLDSSGRPLQIVAVTQPSKGRVAIDGDHLVYTPSPSLPAVEAFTYTISNGAGGLASGLVTVYRPVKRTRATAAPSSTAPAARNGDAARPRKAAAPAHCARCAADPGAASP